MLQRLRCSDERVLALDSANFGYVPLLVGYHRPGSLREAVDLLAQPHHVPLAGGTHLNADRSRSELIGVDLQSLGLDSISIEGSTATIGAMVRLSEVEREFEGDLLSVAARRELPSALRTLGTVGGSVAVSGGENLIVAALLASSATLEFESGSRCDLVDYLADPSGLITSVHVDTSGPWALEQTGRTPMDTPIVAAMGRTSNDGFIIALTGVSTVPIVVTSIEEVEQIIPPGDFRGSSEYRHHLAVKLSERVIGALS